MCCPILGDGGHMTRLSCMTLAGWLGLVLVGLGSACAASDRKLDGAPVAGNAGTSSTAAGGSAGTANTAGSGNAGASNTAGAGGTDSGACALNCPGPTRGNGHASCTDNQCAIQCAPTLTQCGNECVSLQEDGAHCGRCGA